VQGFTELATEAYRAQTGKRKAPESTDPDADGVELRGTKVGRCKLKPVSVSA